MSEEYIVEAIVEERERGGKREVLVKWEGYDEADDNTWEPLKAVKNTEAYMSYAAAKGKGAECKADEEGDESEDEDAEYEATSESGSESGSDGEWTAPKERTQPTPKQPTPKLGKGKKSPAGVTPPTAGAPKRAPKRARPVDVADVDELSADAIVHVLASWDAPTLKAFGAAVLKETGAGWSAPFGGFKAAGKKGEVLEDLVVVVRSAYEGLGTEGVYSWRSRESEARFSSARIESREVDDEAATLIAGINAAFTRAQSAIVSKKAKAAMCAPAKALLPMLQVLDKAQLAQLVCQLVDDGEVDEAAVLSRLPSADLEPILAECEKCVKAIRRALPNSRWGSCTDNYGYKRCKSAVATAKRKLLEGAKQFKTSKQWATAKDFATRALPIARDMVVFDHHDNNGARTAAIDALTKLREEAASKLGDQLAD